MQFSEIFVTAAQQLVANRMRSILTALGIIIGIATVILIGTVLEGYRSSIEGELQMLGNNTFQVQKFGPRIVIGNDRAKPRKDITLEMAEAIREDCPSVKYVGPEVWQFREVVSYKGEKTNPTVSLAGATPEFLMNNGYNISEGHFITDRDVHSHTSVVVLGMDIVDKLFPYQSPLGEIVRIRGRKFTVIGVFEAQGNSTFGESRDNHMAIPFTTWQDMLGKHKSINITIMSTGNLTFEKAQDEVIGVLRRIRKVKPGEENDFDIFFNQSLIDTFDNIARYIQIGGILIGLVSLIVGGIGVMNIMLVSVTERTREIGIRKSAGAKRGNILTQFLLEAIALCIIGGVIGFLLGLGVAGTISVMAGMPMSVPLWAVFSPIFSTTVIGVFAGMYPAYKAANLNVVDALRYE